MQYQKMKRNKLPDYLNVDEINKLLDNIEELDFYILVKLGIESGLRISEALNLRVCDIDYRMGELRVNCGKGNKDRIVFLYNSHFLRELKLYISSLKLKQYQKLFNWDRRTIDVKLKNIFRKAGIVKNEVMICINGRRIIKSNAHFHTLRHTHAIISLLSARTISTVSRQLGHNNPGFTLSIYGRIVDRERMDDCALHPLLY